MRLWTITAVLLLAELCTTAQAVTLTELQRRMQQESTLRCHYTQEKQLRELSEPLRSEGRLLLSRSKGVILDQKVPFALTLTVTDSSFTQELEGGGRQSVSREDNPQLFEIIATVKALFSGDLDTLQQNFTLTFSDQESRWQLDLSPQKEPFSLVFESLQVSGQDFIEKLVLKDKAGDLTVLSFTDHSTQPEELSSDEQAYFLR